MQMFHANPRFLQQIFPAQPMPCNGGFPITKSNVSKIIAAQADLGVRIPTNDKRIIVLIAQVRTGAKHSIKVGQNGKPPHADSGLAFR
jgi:hypothetical protein